MAAIFDHLTAIIVGTVLVGTLLFVQMRRQESAIETTVRNRVEWQADEFLSVVQRDLENMSTPAQARHAFGSDRFTIRRRLMADGVTGYTQQISFPTLAVPQDGAASPLAIVSYEMTPTGETVRVGETDRPTYRITRYEYRRGGSVQPTGGAEGLLEFNVLGIERDGGEIGDDPGLDVTGRDVITPQVKVALMAAAPLPARRASDQQTRTMMNAVRRATTVRVTSAAASGGMPPVDPGDPIAPTFPGDPPPPPPTLPINPTGGGTLTPATPSADPDPPTSGGPRLPSTPPPPPPPMTPPPAPPGRDI